MADHICPWWLAYTFDHPLRRLAYKPEVLLAPYLQPGMTALDIGCGMGYFAIGMAKLVGAQGLVIPIDMQPQMLEVLMKRAAKAGVAAQIRPHCCTADDIGTHGPADFAIACYMVHEVPDAPRLLAQVRGNLKPGGRFMILEPKIHVTRQAFAETIETATASGFSVVETPRVALSQAVVLANTGPQV